MPSLGLKESALNWTNSTASTSITVSWDDQCASRSCIGGRSASPGRGGARARYQPKKQKYERSGTEATIAADA